MLDRKASYIPRPASPGGDIWNSCSACQNQMACIFQNTKPLDLRKRGGGVHLHFSSIWVCVTLQRVEAEHLRFTIIYSEVQTTWFPLVWLKGRQKFSVNGQLVDILALQATEMLSQTLFSATVE